MRCPSRRGASEPWPAFRGCLSARVRHQCRALHRGHGVTAPRSSTYPYPALRLVRQGPLPLAIKQRTGPPASCGTAASQHIGAQRRLNSQSLAHAAPVRHVILFGLEPRRVSTLGRASTTRPWLIPRHWCTNADIDAYPLRTCASVLD
jgi:hypothetical protein